MKSGFFRWEGPRRRPYVDVVLYFPLIGDQPVEISFLVDTGADRTLLAPYDAVRLHEDYGLDLASLPRGDPSGGIGGIVETRRIDATVTIGEYSNDFALGIIEPPPGQLPDMPSLLGRDIIYEFAFFLSYRNDRVLFLNSAEEDGLDLPN